MIVLPFYDKDRNICPANTLQVYLNKTEKLRNDTNSLFISFKKPFKKVSSQTLSINRDFRQRHAETAKEPESHMFVSL